MLSVLDAPQDLPLRSTVACQLVRDEHTRHVLTTFEEFVEKLLGCGFVPPALDQDIEDGAMLVDRPPQIGRLAIDLQKDFVNMPLISRLRTSTTEVIGILLPELVRPPPHRFIAEHDAASGHQLFDIAKAQREPEVQPNSMGDNLGGESVTLVGWGGNIRLHALSIASVPPLSGNRRLL